MTPKTLEQHPDLWHRFLILFTAFFVVQAGNEDSKEYVGLDSFCPL